MDASRLAASRLPTGCDSFSTHRALDQPLAGLHNPDISIQVEELGPQHGLRQQNRGMMDMFTYAPSLHLPPVFYGGALPTQLGDPSSPSSERRRTERAISRSPRRSGYFGRR